MRAGKQPAGSAGWPWEAQAFERLPSTAGAPRTPALRGVGGLEEYLENSGRYR